LIAVADEGIDYNVRYPLIEPANAAA